MRQAEAILIASDILSLGKFFLKELLLFFLLLFLLEVEIEMNTDQWTGKDSRKKKYLVFEGGLLGLIIFEQPASLEHLPVLLWVSLYLELG